jgi:hypothetical protein
MPPHRDAEQRARSGFSRTRDRLAQLVRRRKQASPPTGHDAHEHAISESPLKTGPADGGRRAAERRGEVLGGSDVARHPRRHLELDVGEQLGDPDGHDRQDQPRGGGEAADEGDLHERAQRQRAEDQDRQHQQVRHALVGEQQQREHGGRCTQAGLGEVDDAVGPVHEHHADGDEPVEAADHRAVEQDAQRAGARQQQGQPDRQQQDDRERRHHRLAEPAVRRGPEGAPAPAAAVERVLHRGRHLRGSPRLHLPISKRSPPFSRHVGPRLAVERRARVGIPPGVPGVLDGGVVAAAVLEQDGQRVLGRGPAALRRQRVHAAFDVERLEVGPGRLDHRGDEAHVRVDQPAGAVVAHPDVGGGPEGVGLSGAVSSGRCPARTR